MHEEQLLLSPKEASKLTGIPRPTIYILCRSGEWPTVRVGKSIRIPSEALQNWIRQNTVGGSTPKKGQ
jgi:excisionase family DNA binding protein